MGTEPNGPGIRSHNDHTHAGARRRIRGRPPASAWAAEPGSYSGTSVNKEIFLYGDVEPRTDKGKVTFAVKSGAVKNFKLKAQQIMCGATTAEIPVAVAKIKLNASGQGKGTYTNPSVGAFEVKIKVRETARRPARSRRRACAAAR